MTEVRDSSQRELFSVFSLFAGCGGSSIGYRLAGGKVLAVNEFSEYARKIYSANYSDTFIFDQDIRNLTGELILAQLGMEKGELDILDGSPPCSAFSINGKRQDGWGKVVNYSNTKQRVDDLFFEYVRILNELKPKVFIAENVKGLTEGDVKGLLGQKEQQMMFDFAEEKEKTIIEEFQACGYDVEYQVLNSCHFGVPQTRERIFIIGVRKDLGIKPVFPRPFNYIVTTKEAIEDLQDLGTDDTSSTESSMFQNMKKYFPALTTSARVTEMKRKHPVELKKAFEQHYRRDRWEEPYYTIKQHHTRPFHPIVDRYMSVAEGKRIQSFPDDYQFNLSPVKNWEFIGRAVPPLLMKAIAETIYEKVLK